MRRRAYFAEILMSLAEPEYRGRAAFMAA